MLFIRILPTILLIFLWNFPSNAAKEGRKIPSEASLWKSNSQLKLLAKKFDVRPFILSSQTKAPSASSAGALGSNQVLGARFDVGIQAMGLELIRLGLARGESGLLDRGVSALEWGLKRVSKDRSFGTSTYTDIARFLGAYGHSLTLLSQNGDSLRHERLIRVRDELSVALGNTHAMILERAWDAREKETPASLQRSQAACAAAWMSTVLGENQPLRDSALQWLSVLIARQLPDGRFDEDPRNHAEILDDLSALALSGSPWRELLLEPLSRGFGWVFADKPGARHVRPTALVFFGALTADPRATQWLRTGPGDRSLNHKRGAPARNS